MIGGKRIPAGTKLWLNVMAIHHDPAHYPQPEVLTWPVARKPGDVLAAHSGCCNWTSAMGLTLCARNDADDVVTTRSPASRAPAGMGPMVCWTSLLSAHRRGRALASTR